MGRRMTPAGTAPAADAGGLVRRLEEARKFFHHNLRECCGERDTTGTCMAPACSFGDAFKAVDESVAALSAHAAGWTPVSERLPEPDTEVLVYYNGCSVYTADVDRKGKGVFIGDKWHEWSVITHWMPLPAAPERGK